MPMRDVLVFFVVSVSVFQLNCLAFLSNKIGTGAVTSRPFSLPKQKMGQILSATSENVTETDAGLRTRAGAKIKVKTKTQKARKTRRRRKNEKAREIFSFLTTRYGIDFKNAEWSKARRYIYHATATSTSKAKANTTKNPLSVAQVASVVDFLDEIFHHPLSNTNTMQIIATVPRIVRKNPTSYLTPTVEFLKGLYHGPMFFEAVQRNPNLLLTSGVGFNGSNSGDSIGGGAKTGAMTKRKGVENENVDDNDGPDPGDGNGDGDDPTDSERNTEPSVEEYLLNESLGLSTRKITKLKSSHPTIFQLSVHTKVDPIIEHLVASISSSNTNANTKSNDLTMNRSIVGKMIASNPNILNLSIDNIQAKITFLQSCGFDAEESLRGLWKKYPGILSLSLEQNLRPTTWQLKNLLNRGIRGRSRGRSHGDGSDVCDDLTDGNESDMKNQQLFKILSLHPQLLALSVDNMMSKISYFDSIDDLAGGRNIKNATTTSSHSLATRVALSAPSVYSLSLEHNIIPKVNCLARLWNVEAPFASTFISTSTSTTYRKGFKGRAYTSKTTENDNGRGADVRYSNATTLSRQLSEYPNILTLSLEGNIEPTIMFFNRTGYVTLDEDGSSHNSYLTISNTSKAMKCHPSTSISTYLPSRYIATSLFNRLLPRWNYHVIQEAERLNRDKDKLQTGVTVDNAIVADGSNGDGSGDGANAPSGTSKPPLHVLAGSTDEMFCKRMSYNHALYTQFKTEAIPKLKFSSQFATWLKTGRPIDDI